MKKIPLQNNKGFALVDNEDFEELSQYKWFLKWSGYAVRRTFGRGGKHVLMHRQILQAEKGTVIDHINRNKLDNRKTNIRFCTVAQNGWNRGCASHNTSGFKGVYRDARRNQHQWFIKLVVNKQPLYLGSFNTPEEAYSVYKKKITEIHGDFAMI